MLDDLQGVARAGLEGQPWKAEPCKPILGYTDSQTVKLDFDDRRFKSVKYWALKANEIAS